MKHIGSAHFVERNHKKFCGNRTKDFIFSHKFSYGEYIKVDINGAQSLANQALLQIIPITQNKLTIYIRR